ncbi:PP-loop domain protein [uncultured delta proteobacterium]|uniref:PP-loop domain protein n=1 Tax=uncultured delta proteobacterium TaxID=34034 RepID=A0A212JW66_9DELT|nr:PP-loop domain protein [uncultured delta proteobacterium]
MPRQKYTYAQQQCIRSAGKLSQMTGMLTPHARVGIAVSGGMDSFVLLETLRIRQGIVPFPFSILALHINPGFDPHSHAPLTRWLEERGVAGHIETTDHGPRAHSPENRKDSPCFFCAMLRRKRLFELCRQYGLTHLAFGHTADDLVSTFFMNLCQNGRVEGMSMREEFFKGALLVIRPLMLVEKKTIAKAARDWDLPIWSNPCPSAGKTLRTSIMDDVGRMAEGHKGMLTKIRAGLCRWQLKATTGGPGERL